jgi:hypothetical protein
MSNFLCDRDIVIDIERNKSKYLSVVKTTRWFCVSEGKCPQLVNLVSKTTCLHESDVLSIINKV